MKWIEVVGTTNDVDYNVKMIVICIFILVALFGVCVYLSNKLQIYHPSLRTTGSKSKKKRNKYHE